MKFVRLIMTAMFSMIIVMAFVGISQQVVLYTAVYLVVACLMGEYLLPFLIHLSDQWFELDRRVEEVLPTLSLSHNYRLPDRVRVFVMDDDVPEMTWVGFRTLMVGRGCYNLRPGDFRCALQEALEQRYSLRSFQVLLATIGNAVFLGCRLFCRFGRFLLRALGVLIGAIVSFRHLYTASRVGYAIGDAMYRVFSALFLLICNLTVYIAFSLMLFWADLADDHRLAEQGLRGALVRLIDEIRHTHYTGQFIRERALILRAPIGWRLGQLDTVAGRPPTMGALPHARRKHRAIRGDQERSNEILPQEDTPHRKMGHGGLIVPEELRKPGLYHDTDTVTERPTTNATTGSQASFQHRGKYELSDQRLRLRVIKSSKD